MYSLYLKGKTLKQALAVFDPSASITVTALGDTWHPSSGYVDEKILGNVKTVQDVLEFDYDFHGLIEFEATINPYQITYGGNGEFCVSAASEKDIKRLEAKIREQILGG